MPPSSWFLFWIYAERREYEKGSGGVPSKKLKETPLYWKLSLITYHKLISRGFGGWPPRKREWPLNNRANPVTAVCLNLKTLFWADFIFISAFHSPAALSLSTPHPLTMCPPFPIQDGEWWESGAKQWRLFCLHIGIQYVLWWWRIHMEIDVQWSKFSMRNIMDFYLNQ